MLPIYKRLWDSGRMLPERLKYVDSWVEPNFSRCLTVDQLGTKVGASRSCRDGLKFLILCAEVSQGRFCDITRFSRSLLAALQVGDVEKVSIRPPSDSGRI